MKIDNITANTNLIAMSKEEQKVNESAKNIKKITELGADPAQQQEVTDDLLNEIATQITSTIAYKANAKSVEVQNETKDSLLNIKA
jgi:hypothetical protein